jgi:hypothetical protein
VWAADSRHLEADDRSASLADMMPLARVPGVSLFSLQVGRYASQVEPAPAGMTIAPLSVGFPSFAEQASQLAGLDLVITVDTAVAHLAGALALPTWLLIQKPCDWRWLEAGGATAWYPSMRIFRQDEPRQWQPVVHQVRAALLQFQDDSSRLP